MSAHSVSPPSGGSSTARRIEPSDGSGRHVTSECQLSGARNVAARRDDEHLGLLLVLRRDRVHLEVAEPATERDMARPVELGAGRGRRCTFHSSSASRISSIDGVVEVVGEIDAADLGADGSR